MKTTEALEEIGREIQGCQASPVGLIIPPGTSIEAWSDYGKKIVRADGMFTWVLADWAAYGDLKLGQLKEFATLNNMDYSYLCTLSWVAGNVAHSRRREFLSFNHHREVAPLSPSEQSKWLALAEKNGLSIVELRRRIRASQGRKNALQADGPESHTMGTKCDELRSFLTTQPQGWWDDDRKRIWKERLKPIVEFYEKL